jgi:PIN domain nuclease of toxin-antitoxin system
VIVLDTHIWIWLVSDPSRLTESQTATIEMAMGEGLGVSAISVWEVAKLVELGRLELDRPVSEWIEQALDSPGIRLVELTPAVAVASTQLPVSFHRDPADQIIVTMARLLGGPLVTSDRKILDYEYIDAVS